MISAVNGRADVVGPVIQLGDFFPEKRIVEINGSPHEAWVATNRRYPRRVQAQLDKYRNKYLTVVEPISGVSADVSQLSPQERAERALARQQAIEDADEAYQRYVTDSLMALVPTLDEDTADLIDLEAAENLLRQLGYFQTVPDQAPVAGNPGVGEDASPLTGATSAEDSAVSTLPTTSTDS